MNKKKRKILFLDTWQIEEQESWFSFMHRQGWKLIKISNLIATFEKTNPKETEYRCEIYKANDRYENNRQEMYEEFGWDYVGSRYHVHVYREAEGVYANEIHTDPTEQSESIALLLNSIKTRGLIGILSILFMLFIQIDQLNSNVISNYLDDAFLMPLSLVFVNTFIAWNMLSGIIHSYKLASRLKDGIRLNHKINFKSKLLIKKVTAMFIFSFTLISMAYMIVINPVNTNYPSIPETSLPVLQMGDILEDVQYKQTSDGDYSNHYKTDWSMLVPNQYSLHQKVEILPDSTSKVNKWNIQKPSLSSSLYEANNEWVASKLVTAIREEFDHFSPKHYESISGHLDELWLYEGFGQQEILARDGSKVHRVILFNGKEPIDKLLEKVIENIN